MFFGYLGTTHPVVVVVVVVGGGGGGGAIVLVVNVLSKGQRASSMYFHSLVLIN